MLSRLAKLMSGTSQPSHAADLYRQRLAIYESEPLPVEVGGV